MVLSVEQLIVVRIHVRRPPMRARYQDAVVSLM
jgi:hypothetical protein